MFGDDVANQFLIVDQQHPGRRAGSGGRRAAPKPPRAASAWCGPAAASGSHSVTVVPSPGRLSMRKAPPDCSANPLAIGRPSPVPTPISLVVKNGSLARARVAASMPMPVSATVSRT